MLTQQFPDMILEGENSILFLQISRGILSALRLVNSGKLDQIKGSMKYLRKLANNYLPFIMPQTEEAFYNFKNILQVIERTTLFLAQKTGGKMMKLIQSGVNPKEAWDYKMGTKLLELGKMHAIYSIFKNLFKRIEIIKDPVLKEVYNHMCVYFTIDMFTLHLKSLLYAGAIQKEHISIMRKLKESLIEKIAPHALKLVEAINYNDKWLMSSIGHSNGKPYENLYNMAKSIGTLNKFDNGVHPAMKEHYLPYRKRILARL